MDRSTAAVTLVLMPGMDGTGILFAPFVAALDGMFKVRLVDYPGNEGLGYEELTAIARAALPTNDPFILLGESFSGPIAVALAAERPEGLLGVILCSSFVRNPLPLFSPMRNLAGFVPFRMAPLPAIERFLLGRFSTPGLKAAIADALARVSTRALQTRLKAVLSVDVSNLLGAVKVPILYLQAAHDRLVPRSSARHIHALCPTMMRVELEGPHCLLQAAPKKTAEAVIAFGRQLSGNSNDA